MAQQFETFFALVQDRLNLDPDQVPEIKKMIHESMDQAGFFAQKTAISLKGATAISLKDETATATTKGKPLNSWQRFCSVRKQELIGTIQDGVARQEQIKAEWKAKTPAEKKEWSSAHIPDSSKPIAHAETKAKTRPTTGYMLFCKDKRPEVKASGVKPRESFQVLGQMWKALTQTERDEYVKRAKEAHTPSAENEGIEEEGETSVH